MSRKIVKANTILYELQVTATQTALAAELLDGASAKGDRPTGKQAASQTANLPFGTNSSRLPRSRGRLIVKPKEADLAGWTREAYHRQSSRFAIRIIGSIDEHPVHYWQAY